MFDPLKHVQNTTISRHNFSQLYVEDFLYLSSPIVLSDNYTVLPETPLYFHTSFFTNQ